MAILIKDPETDRVVRELAARTGRTITDAVRTAAERELAELPPRKGRIDMAKVGRLLAEIDAMPKINSHLSDDEIIGYDENGVPS
ncbi:type II toxin-antitoxin system VapB family antitoxin [Bosea sp. (in: a-proteobacteria)]|uniref:type II toxin-antitoxin system VapB family antitoxin n=1 Tax=Bosea sp. (in: a-proteobacteria) TaxID=1871050 RepID=UPI002FC78327